MSEKSTKVLLLLTSLVLLLSFKDLIFIHSDSTDAGRKDEALTTADKGSLHENVARGENGRASDDFDEIERPGAAHESDYNEQREYDENDDFGESESSSPSSDATFEKKIPSLKMMKNTAGLQTLKFKFCYSCGYRNAFEQYSQMIQTRFPEIKIVGENFSPATWKLYLAQFFSTAKMILIGCVMFGYNPFTQFNMATPAVFNWALQNKFYASIMMFFLSNSIETHLISTGAFEIYLNDIQIWSKLASDRMPHEKELMQILDMNFNFETEKGAAFENMK